MDTGSPELTCVINQLTNKTQKFHMNGTEHHLNYRSELLNAQSSEGLVTVKNLYHKRICVGCVKLKLS